MADKRPAIRVSIVTMDTHLASAAERARFALKKSIPTLELTIHAASSWTVDSQALANCLRSEEHTSELQSH